MSALYRAELLKLFRQPSILFWGFLAPPLAAILFKAALEGMVFLRAGRTLGGGDLLQSAARSLAISGNSVAQLLFAIAISTVFFAEYRHATWRLMVPRAARGALWAAKLLACLTCLGASLIVAAAGDLATNILFALTGAGGLASLIVDPGGLPLLAGQFCISLAELAVLAAVVSAITIIARSMIAAVISAFLLALGATAVQVYLAGKLPVVPMPYYGAQALRNWLSSGADAVIGANGLLVLAVWLVVPAVVGYVAFQRQQLAVE
ncbi:hypothetical protein [Rhizobium halophytocola]|uniref:ABC transporter permease n=1 Tax=Rhizobium halophytocola TaxID=735519 RepID=A0ABS4DWZ7_9HYPH|nr:hypothetical protein [Rhizobium halophytocola]MBP1850217.1 hypothetical protein [Rhizobium halophytocola]